jgi:hypothetical protein
MLTPRRMRPQGGPTWPAASGERGCAYQHALAEANIEFEVLPAEQRDKTERGPLRGQPAAARSLIFPATCFESRAVPRRIAELKL